MSKTFDAVTVAAILDVHRSTVTRLVQAGELRASKGRGRTGRLRIDPDSVASYIERHTVPGGTS